MKRLLIGVDPGYSGAIAVLPEGETPLWIKTSETKHDLHSFLDNLIIAFSDTHEPQGLIEKVHAMPGQGISSSCKFCQSFGQLEMLLVCCKVPYELISPAKWQGLMNCRTKGDKNVTKAAAQRLFPNTKITHANADALLIARCIEKL